MYHVGLLPDDEAAQPPDALQQPMYVAHPVFAKRVRARALLPRPLHQGAGTQAGQRGFHPTRGQMLEQAEQDLFAAANLATGDTSSAFRGRLALPGAFVGAFIREGIPPPSCRVHPRAHGRFQAPGFQDGPQRGPQSGAGALRVAGRQVLGGSNGL